MTPIAAPILALCAFLVGFAWGRRYALDEVEQTAKRAEHKVDHLSAQVNDHENRLRDLEDPACSCGNPNCGKVTS